jgi:hypothetical protein
VEKELSAMVHGSSAVIEFPRKTRNFAPPSFEGFAFNLQNKCTPAILKAQAVNVGRFGVVISKKAKSCGMAFLLTLLRG